MGELASDRAMKLSKTIGGIDSEGRTVNVNVVFDDKATITWEYSGGNDVSDRTYTGKYAEELKLGDQMALGITSEIGNTQSNRTQVNMAAAPEHVTFDSNGNPSMNDGQKREAAKTGAHEDGHVLGMRHETDSKNKFKAVQSNDPKNLFNESSNGSNVLPAQRTAMINLIEQQQPKKQ